MTRIFISSKTKHAPRWKQLRTDGAPIISSWIDEAVIGESKDYGNLWKRCIEESSHADAFIIYREKDEILKGVWIELGAALSHNVPVFAVGIEEFLIANHIGIVHCKNFEEAFWKAMQKTGYV
jgi:hypothetical protein